jgi:hypothetical protein
LGARAAERCREGAIAYVCMDWRHMREMLAAGDAVFHELKNLCVWNKTNGGMGSFYRSKHELVFVWKVRHGRHVNSFGLGDTGRYRTNVWDYAGVNTFRASRDADLAMHPTVKPVALVGEAAGRRGLRPKAVPRAGSRVRGVSPFSRGQLHHLLTNPLYIGRIRHKDQIYPGRHAAIIDDALWQDVQAKLLDASARPRGHSETVTESRILTGKLRDETGDLLTPTHTQRHGKRFAYYVSNRLIAGGTDTTGWRLPAEALEAFLRQVVIQHLQRAAETHTILARPDASTASELARRASTLADRICREPKLLGQVIVSGALVQGQVALHLNATAIVTALHINAGELSADLTTIEQPFALRRRGIETKIIAGETTAAPDPVLQRTLAEAHLWARALRTGKSLIEIAEECGRSEPYIRTRIPLAFLAPRLQAAILDGRQPANLSVAQLIRDGIPMDWTEQAKTFRVA